MSGIVVKMKSRFLRQALGVLAVLVALSGLHGPVRAADLPTAAGSPIAGITFDDRPLMLPVQRNFQMAMLTASSEMGRSCGRMEAYGWRMENDEQQRVNQIFNNTVDRLRAQGYVVEAKQSGAVSRDVTLFAADRQDKHLIFLWSAGEIGLVMVLCETSAPLSPIPENVLKNAETAQPAHLPSHLPIAKSVRSSGRAGTAEPLPLTRTGKPTYESFSPVGEWKGSYTCAQGTTGATLSISKLKGDQFEGTFRFYGTAKNPYVPSGKYVVFGEYDRDSQRILVNPGKWLDRPKNYYNTIMIGSFDPAAKTFSGFFQGITGCTSFEARSESARADEALDSVLKGVESKKPAKAAKPAVKKTKKTASPAKKAEPEAKPKETAITPMSEGEKPKDPVQPRESSLEPPTGIAVGEPAKQ